MREAGTHLTQAQQSYKRNFDARLWQQRKNLLPGNHVFLRVDKHTRTDGHHKLAPVTSGPFPVKSLQQQTVLIERPNQTEERV